MWIKNKVAQVSMEVVFCIAVFAGLLLYMDFKKTTESNQFRDQSKQTNFDYKNTGLFNIVFGGSKDCGGKSNPCIAYIPTPSTPVVKSSSLVVFEPSEDRVVKPVVIKGNTLLLIFRIFSTLLLAVFCGWMFRIGGAAGENARWARMLGVEIAEFLGLVIWFIIGVSFPINFSIFWHTFSLSFWVVLFSIFLTSALAWTECTYFKSKGSSASWLNWMFCGIQYALIPLPLVILGIVPLVGFLIRFAILVPIITLWRLAFSSWDWAGNKDVDFSEGGAGAWQIVTLPLLTIT
jgi:hypothetical protein